MVHTLAKEYGQTKDYIWYNMDVDDFLAVQGFNSYEDYLTRTDD